jgi:hypothetical protein
VKVAAETSLDMNVHETGCGDKMAKVECVTLRTGGGGSRMNGCDCAVGDLDLDVSEMLARRAEIATQETLDVPRCHEIFYPAYVCKLTAISITAL